MSNQRARLVASVMSGQSYVHVADQFGVSVKTAWRWVQEDVDRPPVRHRGRLSDKIREAIKRDIEAGEISMYQIADRHGVHHSTVYKIRDEIGSIFNFKVRRCPTCGGRINTRICMACQLRNPPPS